MHRPADVVVEEFGLEYVVDVDFGRFSGQCVVKAPSASEAKAAGKSFLTFEYLNEMASLYRDGALVNAHPLAEDEEDD